MGWGKEVETKHREHKPRFNAIFIPFAREAATVAMEERVNAVAKRHLAAGPPFGTQGNPGGVFA